MGIFHAIKVPKRRGKKRHWSLKDRLNSTELCMDLLLKIACTPYVTEEFWFRENRAGSKKIGYRLEQFTVLREAV